MTGRERLQRLADVLDVVDPSKFSMSAWRCGTVACAVGHAALDPILRSEGLHLEGTGWLMKGLYTPWFQSDRGIFAAATFFEIPLGTARYFFLLSSYKGAVHPTTVAARIRRYLDDPLLNDEGVYAP